MGAKCVRPCLRGSDDAVEGPVAVCVEKPQRKVSFNPTPAATPARPECEVEEAEAQTSEFQSSSVDCLRCGCSRSRQTKREKHEEDDDPTRVRETVAQLKLRQAALFGAGSLLGADSTRVVGEPPFSRDVTLNIYTIGRSSWVATFNNLLKHVDSGAFHCGVEVFGREWSYSHAEGGQGNGVFHCIPRECPDHSYLESVKIGTTINSEDEVIDLLWHMSCDWPVARYNILTCNCCHFCNELCQRLGVGQIPDRVLNLAGFGAAIVNAHDGTLCYRVSEGVSDNCCCQDDDFGVVVRETMVMRETSKSRADIESLVQGWRL